MYYSLLSMMAVGAGTPNTSFLVAIALLACLLGAEIAGICILISKMARARRERYRSEEEEAAESHNSTYHYSIGGGVMLLGAIPQISYRALAVLSALTVLGAIVFVILLIVCRVKGYDFAASAWYVAAQRRKDEPKEAPTLDEEPTFAAVAQESYPDESEEQRQEAYTESELTEDDEEPFAAFAEEESEEDTTEEESVPEVLEGELVQAPTPVEPMTSQTTVTEVRNGPVFADGTQPYKVVEKVVTEKVTEVYKETPVENKSTTNDQVLEKLVDLLDYEIRSRRESEKSESGENGTNAKNGTVATFATSALPDDEDEDEEDENEDDELDETADGGSEDDEDRDDEENDTDGDHFTGNERIIGFDEETGCYIVAHYRKSFEAKLIQARPNIKQYYSDIKNALLSYKGTKNRISWTADSFHNGRTPIAKINVKTRILELYLALDPASLEGTVYRGQDVGNKKKYADTPFRYKLRTPRKLKWALELIQRTCEEHGLSPIDIEHVNYDEQYPFDTTENLVERKLIKEYIRQEKPATTFELDPDHVPSVPEEDESVIPANANFSWEFDNERMEEPEAEPVVETTPEPEPEPTPEPEPVPEPASEPAPQASIVRETVKVTEMRYTERYYANAEPTYEQVITTTEPIAVISEPVEESATEEIAEEELTVAEESAITEEYESVDESTEEETDDEELFFDGEQTEDSIVAENVDAEGYPFRPSFYADSTYETEDAEVEEEAEAVEETVEEEEIEEEAEESPKKSINPAIAVVDICSVEEHFDAGDVIDLNSLKEKNLILPGATTLKIYAGGELSKPFTVEAHQFTMDAIKAISDADGDSVMVR